MDIFLLIWGQASKATIQLWNPCCQILAAQELWDDPCPAQDLSPT